MARIPDAELEGLKRETPLAVLVEHSGVQLEKRGADLIGRCPFHADKTPSLVVSPSKNLWHCLGACRTGGSVVDWVMRRDGCSFREAVDVLRGGAAAALDVSGTDPEVLGRVVDHYQRALESSPEALAYLDERGLSRALVVRFRLGYANRTLGHRVHSRVARERLQELGVFRKESGHEHLNGSLVIPLVDEAGSVVNLYGRKIRDDLRAGTPKHLYLPGPHRGLFNPAALSHKTMIVCEALIDALTFLSAGIDNVTTAYGVEGFTDELFAALVAHQAERVLIAYDADAAGDAAAHALSERLERAGIGSARIVFPKGMDANDYARKVQPAAKSLALAVERAAPLRDAAPTWQPAAKEEAAKAVAPPSAAPLAPEPAPAVDVDVDELRVALGDRHWRARGLLKNTTQASLRVTLTVARGEAMHTDTLDLYTSKARAFFVREAARELGADEDVIKRDLGRVLIALEEAIDRRLAAAAAPKAAPAMTPDEQAEAEALLSDPRLVEHIVSDLSRLGLVGEETNKLVLYLAMTSRKLAQPLGVVVQSSSAAGKSSLMDAVLELCPTEEMQKYSAMTGQALFYMAGADLRHKVLAVVEEAGAERASYALKLLQSEGELSIASTGKDEKTGKLVTHEYKVEGPVALMLTTTSVDMDEELLNRCLVLTVDEGRAQTRAIHDAQRRRHTLEGVIGAKKHEGLVRLHQNAQRLLRPLHVVNPYADKLTFRDDKTRLRRDHAKYLALIDAIALVHQHQRPMRSVLVAGQPVCYIEATLDDVAVANKLAHAVLGRSLDELPPQTRALLGKLKGYAEERAKKEGINAGELRFSRRDVRDALVIGDTQLKIHLARLVELELVHAHRHGLRVLYELCWRGEGADGAPVLLGLLDVEKLKYDSIRSGSAATRSGVGRGPVGGRSGVGRPPVIDDEPVAEPKRGVLGRALVGPVATEAA